MTTRRNFLKNTTMLAAGLGVSPLLSSSPLRSYQKEEVINGKVRIAVIGVGMGCRDLQGALTDNPWVHCVGMCDVNKVRLEEQLARFKKDFPEQTVSIKAYTDFREVLEAKAKFSTSTAIKKLMGLLLPRPTIGILIFLQKP